MRLSRFRRRAVFTFAAAVFMALAAPAQAQRVEVEELTLDNGMKFLLVPRTDQPNSITAGWVAKVGAVNERPGITGISHFFEHMMFKGTNTIGTRDAKQDAQFMARQKAIKDEINDLIWGEQYRRYLAGEIDDPWNPVHDTEQLAKLRAQLKSQMEEHGKEIVKNEFDSIYTKAGASGMNAFTAADLTFYFITIPSNKFELWTWMESDRLTDSVFREFYSERDVVHEERRLRVESQPTGLIEEQLNAMFWHSAPYSWPIIGWPCDMFSYTREQFDAYFNIYYRPNNLVGVIVGDFKAAEAKELIGKYFTRLKRGEQTPPPVVTVEVKQVGEKRMEAECECQNQVEIRYHTVPFNHADSFALEMMGEILSGRTGRLYKSMVEGKEIASAAEASQAAPPAPAKYAGYFSFAAEVKGDATPQQLEQAWYEQLAKLQTEPMDEHELQKVRNQVAADAYRQLQANFLLMLRLGICEALGDWRYVNESPAKLQGVTASDIQRVAKKYFEKSNRTVALLTRKGGSASSEDPALAALDAKAQQDIRRGLAQLALIKDVQLLKNQLATMEAMVNSPSMPPARLPVAKYMLEKVRQRIAELEAQPGTVTAPAPPPPARTEPNK